MTQQEKYIVPATILIGKEIIDPLRDILGPQGIDVDAILNKALRGEHLSEFEHTIVDAAGYVEASKIVKK